MTKRQTITSDELDKIFDAGEDVSGFIVEESAAIIAPKKTQIINAELPTWIVEALDSEAKLLNVPRRSVINMWLAEKARERQSSLIAS